MRSRECCVVFSHRMDSLAREAKGCSKITVSSMKQDVVFIAKNKSDENSQLIYNPVMHEIYQF